MRDALILGSGPAAAGVALALTQSGIRPTVVDIGATLERANQEAIARMRAARPEQWTMHDHSLITRQPVDSLVDGLPEKRAFGSDFPFRDFGQLSGVTADGEAHRSVISAAYGGFSNVWGAQLMPFSASTFADWPITFAQMDPHYRAILAELPFSGVDDDLTRLFPLLREPSPLAGLSQRTERVLGAYERHRSDLRRCGITVGQARLAATSTRCVLSGLCMTGCPYGLVYSASHTFDRLRQANKIEYLGERMAVGIGEVGGIPQVTVRVMPDQRTEMLSAGRVFVACGAIGSTRLVAGSLGMSGVDIPMQESAQFTMPFLSARRTSDPTNTARFTLNQFNMVLELPGQASNISQIHFYSYNDAFFSALPGVLKRTRMRKAAIEVLRRLTVGIGYLPSWHSPQLQIQVGDTKQGELPEINVTRATAAWTENAMLRAVKRRLLEAAPMLDLWPVFTQTIFAAGAKSYHFGSSFPHQVNPEIQMASDLQGRVGGWKNIHMVDAAVFPSVPATTFTFTIMANAHRIASEVMEFDGGAFRAAQEAAQ